MINMKIYNNSFTDSSYRDIENKNSCFSNSGNKMVSIFGIIVPIPIILSKHCEIIERTSKIFGLQCNLPVSSIGSTVTVIKGVLKCNFNEYYP